MKVYKLLGSSLILSSLLDMAASQQIHDPAEILQHVAESTLTCSSAIRLQNLGSSYYLHSSEVGYGQGSG